MQYQHNTCYKLECQMSVALHRQLDEFIVCCFYCQYYCNCV